MQNTQPAVQPIHSTRRAVLEALKTASQASTNQLAEMIGVKAITIRHHLNALMAEGLVEVQEKRQPIGRPVFLYCLTDQAEGLFPHQYHRLVERLLDQVKEKLSPETVEMLINSLAMSLADDLRRELDRVPAEDRLARLVSLLGQEGFMAQWEYTEGGLRLIEYHCPYYFVGQRHPEVCQIDETLIRLVLNADVARETCLLSGDSSCKFILRDSRDEVSP